MEVLQILSIDSYKAKVKGNVGEKRIAKILENLPKDSYVVLHDCVFNNQKYNTQIDHLIISVYGIFILETKNWSGNLYGDQYKEKWKLYIGNKSISVNNPIKQNWIHTKMVKEIVGMSNINIPIYSFIVFTSSINILKVETEVPVIKEHLLLTTIKEYSRMPIISEIQLNQLTQLFKNKNITNPNVRDNILQQKLQNNTRNNETRVSQPYIKHNKNTSTISRELKLFNKTIQKIIRLFIVIPILVFAFSILVSAFIGLFIFFDEFTNKDSETLNIYEDYLQNNNNDGYVEYQNPWK